MLQSYPKEIMCKDGTPVVLRPLVREDEERLREFFSRLPEEERWFLRDDVADPEILHQWMADLDYDRVLPMVAVVPGEGTIVGNLRIHRRPAECLRHIAHLRIAVDPAYRHRRLGTWMLLDVVRLAIRAGIEKLVAEFVSGVEEPAMQAAERLDFFREGELRDYVKDQEGGYRNLIIMVKTLNRDWCDF